MTATMARSSAGRNHGPPSSGSWYPRWAPSTRSWRVWWRRQGSKGCTSPGPALSNSLARPDEGVIPRSRVLEFTREIVEAVSIPVIVDVDTGFGGPKGTAETVRLFEAAGAAAVQIEDQDARWKRCATSKART